MIVRDLTSVIKNNLDKGKVIVLIGPRQVGKTTLVNSLLKDIPFLFLDGDDAVVSDTLANANTETLRNIIGNYKYVFIDEGQRIPNIGLKLKMACYNQFLQLQHLINIMKDMDILHLKYIRQM